MASPPGEQQDQEDASATKEMMHKTRLIQFSGRNTPIILQNKNGPCALLAICNVLLLENTLHLSSSDVTEVSQEELLTHVRGQLIDSVSNANDEVYLTTQQPKIDEIIDLVPQLATGMNVNLKFTGIADFECTSEYALFDILGIRLYHGWLVDPQDNDTAVAIGQKCFNTLSRELVALDTQDPEGKLITSFLQDNATQLTKYGLFCLKEGLKEGELCVLFWNNHFSTMFKFEGGLYLLATDEGLYLSQPNFVWAKLDQVNGYTSYTTCSFKDLSRDGQNALADTSSMEGGYSRRCKRKRLSISMFTDEQVFAEILARKTLPQIAEKFGVDKTTISRRLQKAGGRMAAFSTLSAPASVQLPAKKNQKAMQFRATCFNGDFAVVEVKVVDAKLDNLMAQVAKEFELCAGSFKLQYIDGKDVVELRTNEAMERCKRLMVGGKAEIRVVKLS